MTSEVLAMFEQAGAKRSDYNLKIEFNFDRSLSPEAMSLRRFREQVKTLRKISQSDERARLVSENATLPEGFEAHFQDLPNLPIWKRRHELYAGWVASRIRAGFLGAKVDWYPDGDKLRSLFPERSSQASRFARDILCFGQRRELHWLRWYLRAPAYPVGLPTGRNASAPNECNALRR